MSCNVKSREMALQESSAAFIVVLLPVIQSDSIRRCVIFLTAATTVRGPKPLWLGDGPMSVPVAIPIILGPLFPTLLSLRSATRSTSDLHPGPGSGCA